MKYRVSLLIRINIYARILCINIVSFIINVYSLVTCMIFTWQIVMFKPEFICFFRMLRNISSGLNTCPQCQENTDVTAHLQNWSGAQRLSSLLHATQFRRVLKLHCWVRYLTVMMGSLVPVFPSQTRQCLRKCICRMQK